jgi:hypothetical protein
MTPQQLTTLLLPVEPHTEKNAFLGNLPPIINQDDHITKIAPIHRDDPKLSWVFQNMDFKEWELPGSSQMLWLFGPHDRGITELSSHFVRLEMQKLSQTNAIFYFFCSILESERLVAFNFAYAILQYVLDGVDEDPAKSIITTFLSALLHKILQRKQRCSQLEDSSSITVNNILDVSSVGELLGALKEAVVEIKTIPDTPIIIDRIDKLGIEGAQFIAKFCSQREEIITPKFKVLLTCRTDPHIQELVSGVPRIEYNKERQGLGKSYSLVTRCSI